MPNNAPRPSKKQQALTWLQSGRLQEARTLCEQICRDDAQDAEAWLLQALIHLQLGVLAEAIACARQALALQPDNPEIYNLLGYTLYQQGNPGEAAANCQQALRLRPDYADAHNNLGNALRAEGHLEEAVACYRRALQRKPEYAEACNNLANTLQEMGKLDEAVVSYRETLRIKPGYAEAHNNLGLILQEQGRWDEAMTSYQTALRLKPDFAQAHNNLANVYLEKGMVESAIQSYQAALGFNPDFPDACYNLGNALTRRRRMDEARASYQRAIRIKPDFAEAHHNLGFALQLEGQFDAAAAYFREALRLKPDYAEPYNDLANGFNARGMHDAAVANYRNALRIKPNFERAHSNLLFALNYYMTDSALIFREHCQWAEQHAARVATYTTYANLADPHRRLKIGYVSPDLRAHSVAFFFMPLLAHHDPATIENACYFDVIDPDTVTQKFQVLSDHWRDIRGLSHEQVAELIRADGIDILVDLAGHTAHNSLLVFTRQPAPVQVTYLGYPNTTGLSTIDYRLTDAWADPPGMTEAFHTETLVRLPHGFLCYQAAENAPAVAPLPSLATGHITFGSFNAMNKVTPEVVRLWARLLSSVTGARLILKGKSLQDKSTRDRYHRLFAEHGIAPERVELIAHAPRFEDHLALYGRIDIALDTFPYHGTTTTCEALWMGVPVITLAGRLHAGRVGVSLLSQVGLPELIAQDPEDYRAKAVALAHDRERLTRLRHTLRPRMQASSLCDGPAFTRDVEAAYRGMWRKWCNSR